MTSVVIDPKYRGPAVSGNGGYTAGLLAEALGGGLAGPVQVTLRVPPPLSRQLDITSAGELTRLLDGEAVVAEALRVEAFGDSVVAVGIAEATAASTTYGGHRVHPFPGCFSCGPDRAVGDGLRIFPGRLEDPVYVAAPWLALGEISVPIVWAALDCTSGWSVDLEGRPSVLGRMTAVIHEIPRPDHTYVMVGVERKVEGRKAFTASALYDGERLLAEARQVWIQINPDDFNS
jgi:hypothetical protein